ncbi:MAG TPA: glycosyltransferase family A protein [Candidatus Paceibacterota bacterium]|jgi:glycosyltransferase involved in cell wall biosynthesis|nr:glycosyltransferase family A protein [Candidatus Paceibacterota bacterium]
MKVSVVIPAHNEESNIAQTIEKLLAQDHTNLEIIIVDNASTDRTSEVARKFERSGTSSGHSPTISVKVVHESKKGLLYARERGRREATGEIIVNMDADCLPERDHISRGIAHFKENAHKEHIVAVTGPYDYHDGHPLFRSVSLSLQKYIYRFTSNLLQLPLIKKGAVLIGGNNFIRADILEKAGGYNVAITFYGEDTDTAKRVAPYGKVHFDPHLSIKTSARRFKEEGNFNITFKYLYHFWKTIFSSVKNKVK